MNAEEIIVAHFDSFVQGHEHELVAIVERALGLRPGTILELSAKDLHEIAEAPESGRPGAGLPNCTKMS